jgi:hypothetical protein
LTAAGPLVIIPAFSITQHRQEQTSMGRGDRRKSPKVRRRKSQRKFKERQKRKRQEADNKAKKSAQSDDG